MWTFKTTEKQKNLFYFKQGGNSLSSKLNISNNNEFFNLIKLLYFWEGIGGGEEWLGALG